MFNTREGQNIVKKIAAAMAAEDKERQLPPSTRLLRKPPRDKWKKIKEQYYPSKPIIQLPEMDFQTLYPYGRPREEGITFEFSERTSERYNRSGANRFRKQGSKWSD